MPMVMITEGQIVINASELDELKRERERFAGETPEVIVLRKENARLHALLDEIRARERGEPARTPAITGTDKNSMAVDDTEKADPSRITPKSPKPVRNRGNE